MGNIYPPINSAVTPLIDGYRQFKSTHIEKTDLFSDLVEQGQSPKVVIVACCDSRVDPAIVMNAQPGDLFVVRNVANLVPPFTGDQRHHGTSAALEFGVKGLGVSDIILFGHSHCGGIRALMEHSSHESSSDFIDAWMDIAKPAKEQVLTTYPQQNFDEQCHICEKTLLLLSLENLMSFPWIAERVRAGQLALHAWYFDLAAGAIEAYHSQSKQFISL